ncbi:hypothetical protein HOK09_03220 [Candidatus Woesearchaeota archaeon]|jgi:hypothetical protein|nr:hypothetical protein [Candidatus Woesearchaeota archaeon]MBT6774157.1 hypothetical protein [Candidatus Woesearchaeota archaeon]
MNELALKKKSLEESLSSHTSGVIESERRVEVVGENVLVEVLENFEKFLERDIPEDVPFELDEKYFQGIPYVLSNHELNAFLQATPHLKDNEDYKRYLGYFISKLVDNAFIAGHNNYQIDLVDLPPLDEVCLELRDRDLGYPLVVNVVGNVGSDFAWGAEKCRINFEGNANHYFCANVKDSEIYARGNMGSDAFEEISGSIVRIEGDFQNLGYNIDGSIFKTADEYLLKKLLDSKSGIKLGSDNKVIFIKPDGTEELVRDYS